MCLVHVGIVQITKQLRVDTSSKTTATADAAAPSIAEPTVQAGPAAITGAAAAADTVAVQWDNSLLVLVLMLLLLLLLWVVGLCLWVHWTLCPRKSVIFAFGHDRTGTGLVISCGRNRLLLLLQLLILLCGPRSICLVL